MNRAAQDLYLVYNEPTPPNEVIMLDYIVKPGLLFTWLNELQAYTIPVTHLPQVSGLDIEMNREIPSRQEVQEILQHPSLADYTGPYRPDFDKGIVAYYDHLKSTRDPRITPKIVQAPVSNKHGMKLRRRAVRVLHTNIYLYVDK